jgi:hypothetical protein
MRYYQLICAALFLLLSSCMPMCPLPNCQVRMKHSHLASQFRGRKWWKTQNLQVGQRTKKARYIKEINVHYNIDIDAENRKVAAFVAGLNKKAQKSAATATDSTKAATKSAKITEPKKEETAPLPTTPEEEKK